MTSKNQLAYAVKLALFAGAASAVTAPTFAADSVEDVERIEVTGSRIKRTDMENASPVVVVSAEEIAARGFSTAQDVLDALTQNSGGSLTQQESFGFTPAASGVNLRGVGLGRSLTLIDGKRVPKYPFAAGGADNFTDTANIPAGAIERIEVLTTGASAIYGSDAMGGVINIILKKEVEDTIVKLYGSTTDDGGKETGKISILSGVSGEDGRMLFFLEHENRNKLMASDRGFLGSDLGDGHPRGNYSSYGASLRNADGDVVKTLSAEECAERGFQWTGSNCGFNRSSMRQLLPDADRTSLMLKFNKELGSDHELYSRVDYTHSNVANRVEAMPLDDYLFTVNGGQVTVTPDVANSSLSQSYDQATAFNGDFVGLADGEYYYTRRAVEFGPRASDFTTNNFTLLTGIKGYLGDYEYDTSWSFSRQKVDREGSGYATVDGYFKYLTSCENGCSQLLAVTDEQVAMAAFQPMKKGESSMVSWNAGISGDLFDLDAGTVQFAAGLEMNKEWFFDRSDSFSINGEVLSTGGAAGEGSRKQYAAYTEVAVPVMENLTATLAGRYDHYDDASDVGGAFSPQVAIEYRPMEDLLLRALWAETFRAPDMQRLFGEPTRGFVSDVVDFQSCAQDGIGFDACATNEDYRITSVNSISGPNNELEEETGENWNLGVVYNLNGLDISVDVWNVEIENIVSDLSVSDVFEKHEIYGNLIDRDPVTGRVTVNTQAMNLARQEVAGVDLSLGYLLDTAALGSFKFKLEGTYNSKWEEQVAEGFEVTNELARGGIPRWRANFSTRWAPTDTLSTTVLVKFIDEHKAANYYKFGTQPDYSLRVAEHFEVNWNVTYDVLDSVTLAAGINNLFDEGPEVDNTLGWPFYDSSYYSPVGREFYASAELRF
ncbi:TonB-dependent receptor [Gallaecimonas sp. GXIMD4217]|uniref:TonB-dependent receptor plug domain-containing protein n=1 Tax=Gallaecimonas sp. GXIMD4217 TaxID=3131927 RepID=UPI00311B1613